MIHKAFIFVVGQGKEYINCYEMEVTIGLDPESQTEWRKRIQELYERMSGRPCEVHWDFEYRGTTPSAS